VRAQWFRHASAVVIASLAVAGGLACPGAARAAPARTGGEPVWVPRPGPAAASPGVLLINGDRLVPGPGGAGSPAQLVPAAGQPLASAILGFGAGRDRFLIPQAALPYLGHGLDLSLFRPDWLRAAEDNGRLPLTISYRQREPSLPGVTVTRAAHGVATGYLTAAGARAFGMALAQRALAKGMNASQRGGLFAGGVSLTLAGAPAQPPQRPAAFPMHTLTVTGTNLKGRPDNSARDSALVINADDTRRFQEISSFYRGRAKLSVPAGHYWALGNFVTGPRRGEFTSHVPIVPQFTVRKDTTVHLAAQAATSLIRVVTPRRAVPDDALTEFRHPTPEGPAADVWWLGYGPMYVSPTTRRPTVGSLHEYNFEQLRSPAAASGVPYQYNVAFAWSGLIPPQRYVVRPAGLATVHARYYSDVNTTGSQSRFGLFPVQWPGLPGFALNPLGVPRRQTEYLTGNAAVLWSDSYEQSGTAGGQADGLRSFTAGERLAENWNAYPLHAGYNSDLTGAASLHPAIPSASRMGNKLTLDVMPFSDSTPGHLSASGFFGSFFGPPGKITGHYEIDENGTVIASGDPLKHDQAVGPGGQFHTHVVLSPHPSTVRLVLDASRNARIYTISTASHTVWTWRSARRPGARAPAGWDCVPGPQGTAAGHTCAVQPMMTLEYSVAGESLHGSTRPGRQVLHVLAGHLQHAEAAQVTGARVSVSFDGGKTWHAARVTGHSGRYTAVFAAPAGAKVTLRTSATDAAGGSIAETLTGAYQISS
jgi:hypothetical protein